MKVFEELACASFGGWNYQNLRPDFCGSLSEFSFTKK